MPFLKGRAALRRTMGWLEKGEILFRKNVKILSCNYNPGPQYPHHEGLLKFIFWHLPQLKYKNPKVQLVTFKYMTPTPWIKIYLDDDREFLVDCDSRSRQEIHDHVKRVFGKSDELLRTEEMMTASILENPANFGDAFNRQCICEVPGQVPCPGWCPLPKHARGKWLAKVKSGDMTMEELLAESFAEAGGADKVTVKGHPYLPN